MQAYIKASADYLPYSEEVVSASRISDGRVAIYLTAVTDAVQHGLRFDDTFLELTPLSTDYSSHPIKCASGNP